MSRFTLSIALVASLSSFAFAERIARPPEQHFAQPPPSEPATGTVVALLREDIRKQLVIKRTQNLAAFHAYQRRGVFPSNTYGDARLNVWRDADGHLCAAATIIQASGQGVLVGQVAEKTNFIRLADVTDGPLMDWILTSGLTQDEIVAIQEPFMPVGRAQVQPDLRTAENVRLAKRYREVDKMIRDHATQDLEVAVARLMQHPDLAAKTLGHG